ncbi:ATPase, V0 complex, subunit d, partial [Kipferlia bialata]|eukprot:g7295.t1
MSSASNFTLFNGKHGFLEAQIRSRRDTMVSESDYITLTQCQNIQDMIMNMSTSDYSKAVAGMEEPTPSALAERMTQQLVREFENVRESAEEPLCTFLDYMTHGYIIDNVVLLLLGTLHGRDTEALLQRCHPLGMVEGLSSVQAAQNVDDLYHSVIEETPIRQYFPQLSEGEASRYFSETDIELLRNRLYKSYLEHFLDYCLSLKGATRRAMGKILKFEADRRSISIALNSLGTDISSEEKASVLPHLGFLYPGFHEELVEAKDFDAVRGACDVFEDYSAVFSAVVADQSRSIEDEFN